MGRPRKSDLDLPECVYLRRGAYFLVKQGKWIWLSRDRDAAIALSKSIHIPAPTKPDEVRKFFVVKVRQLLASKGNRGGKGRSIEIAITILQAVEIAEKSRWHCQVTGIPFSLEFINGRRPYAPSLDRIDSSAHYTPENCRVV